MTSPLNNWEEEMCRLWFYFGKGVMRNSKHECHFHGGNYKPDQENLLSMLPITEFISTLLQAQREQEQQRILELIVTNYTESGFGDLIPAAWKCFKKDILNQPNNNGN